MMRDADIDVLQAEALQAPPVVNYARLCPISHTGVDEASGIGYVLYSRGEDGYGTEPCENCVDLRAMMKWAAEAAA